MKQKCWGLKYSKAVKVPGHFCSRE